MIVLMWVIAAYGMTNILVYGSIFNGLRNWIHNNAQPNIGWVIFRPINSCQGANNVKDKKNPTQVDVQRTHFIKFEMNSNIGLKITHPIFGCALL